MSQQDHEARMAATEKAAEVRQARTHQTQGQQRVQVVASDIQSQMQNLSPSVAASAGAPLDPTKGYDFDPNARPQELPQPGTAPGGAAQPNNSPGFTGGMMGDMMEAMQGGNPGLVDDRASVLAEMGLESGEPPQQPPMQPPTGNSPMPPQGPPGPPVNSRQVIQAGEVKTVHPILSKLRKDLGLEQVETHDVEIGGSVWTMQTLSPSSLALAARLADTVAETLTERNLIYQTAISAYAIVAIDGIPTYQVFGVEPTPGVVVTNHLRPPQALRHLTSARLFDFLHNEVKTQLPTRLWDAYEDKCDMQGSVESYLDDPANIRVLYVCKEKGCGQRLRIIPNYKPGTKDIILPFCQLHGTPMPALLKEDPASPLA